MPDFIIDPFNEGALLSPSECRQRLEGQIPDDEPLDAKFFQTASKPDMLVRMLLNLKRLYVQMRSFPQARDVTDLLLAINPSGLAELRDRGLLAYHLNDFPSALRDLERYLHQAPTFGEEADRKDQKQLWEHVKTLRRRVSELN
jgi:regulator of sirC expression with transglutaminase-like and TPR domain